MLVCALCLVAQWYPTLCDPMDCSPPDFSSWGFSKQEYGSGFPCPPPGDLPNPGIELRSPALQAYSLLFEPQGKPQKTGVGSLSFLQGVFPTQELNRGLLHCRRILYQLNYQGSPYYAYPLQRDRSPSVIEWDMGWTSPLSVLRCHTSGVSHCLYFLHLGDTCLPVGFGGLFPWGSCVAILGHSSQMLPAVLFRRSCRWWIRPGHPYGGGKISKRCVLRVCFSLLEPYRPIVLYPPTQSAKGSENQKCLHDSFGGKTWHLLLGASCGFCLCCLL